MAVPKMNPQELSQFAYQWLDERLAISDMIAMGEKKVDIFDVYYDKYKKDFIGMKQSEGRVAPNRWNVEPPKPKTKKRRRRQEDEE